MRLRRAHFPVAVAAAASPAVRTRGGYRGRFPQGTVRVSKGDSVPLRIFYVRRISMKHLFMINPVAGNISPADKRQRIEEAVARLPAEVRRNDEFEIHITTAPMDAVRHISSLAESKEPLRVYACGGDGTLNECVNGAAGHPNVAVSHFPCGTGNDFIKMFGEEKERFFDLEELICGEVRPIDVIKCNDRYSINICSVGLDARIGTEVHKYSKVPLIGGPTGYVVSTVVNVVKGISTRMTARAGELSCGPKLNLVCACNGRYYGGGFNPVPDARPDDGMMDCLIVSGVNRFTLLGAILGYAKGKYEKYPQYITHVRTDRLEIEAPENTVVNVDGEAEYAEKIVFELIPGGVNFVFPRNMRFFDGAEN